MEVCLFLSPDFFHAYPDRLEGGEPSARLMSVGECPVAQARHRRHSGLVPLLCSPGRQCSELRLSGTDLREPKSHTRMSDHPFAWFVASCAGRRSCVV